MTKAEKSKLIAEHLGYRARVKNGECEISLIRERTPYGTAYGTTKVVLPMFLGKEWRAFDPYTTIQDCWPLMEMDEGRMAFLNNIDEDFNRIIICRLDNETLRPDNKTKYIRWKGEGQTKQEAFLNAYMEKYIK